MGLNIRSIQNLFALFLALLSIWGIITTTQYGAASLDYYKTKSIISLWQAEGYIDSTEQYQKAKQAAYGAHSKHPEHALYLDLLGQIHEWGQISGYENKKQSLQRAEKHYLNATQIRPTWPVTWASLANVKWRLKELDGEMLMYLQLADKFGPRKKEVNVFFSELGLALYKANNLFLLNIRGQVKRNITTGLRDSASRKMIRAVIKKYDAGMIVCFWLRNEPYDYIGKFITGCNPK
jgi:hypothetical protein